MISHLWNIRFATNVRSKALLVSMLLLLSGCAGTTQSPGGTSSPADLAMSQSDSNRYHTALAQLARGNSAEAIPALRILSNRYPAHVGVWLNLATAYYQASDLDAAETTLSEAVLQDVGLPHLLNLKGLIAVERGQYKHAEEHYQAATAIDPEHAHSHYNLALLYDIFYQDIRAALPHYQRYLALIDEEDRETTSWVRQIENSLGQGGGR